MIEIMLSLQLIFLYVIIIITNMNNIENNIYSNNVFFTQGFNIIILKIAEVNIL